MRLRVYEIAMSADNDAIVLKAANDWLDREEGKAMVRQMIAAQVDVRSESMVAQANETAERMIRIAMERRKKE